jgi:glycosyltransferase involved in cell wall biosynthesis
VSERILEACRGSFIIYNSIDAPALRVPAEVSRHFDLVLTGAERQSEVVRERHPNMPTAVLPIGPDFASPDTFYPIECEKHYDVIYVAAAQSYKRHDLLFDALSRSPRQLNALCVIGYGEDSDRLRHEAAAMGIAVDFVGPPGVPYAEVNRLMNRARVGVVCGIDDGAPAILTEYMLAGLPVVANADLRCGLQYILPQTGVVAPSDGLERGIIEALNRADFKPRRTVLERWAWPHSIAALEALMRRAGWERRSARSFETMKA